MSKKPCKITKCEFFCGTTQCDLWHMMTVHNMPPLWGGALPEAEFEYHMGHLWRHFKGIINGEEENLFRGTNTRDIKVMIAEGTNAQ